MAGGYLRVRETRPAFFDRLWAETLRIARSPIALTLFATALIEAAWGLLTGLRVNLGPVVGLQVAVPGAVALFCRLIGRLRTIGQIADTIFAWTVIAVVGTPLTYLAARADFPLRDDLFRSFDLALGFDGLKWVATINSHPWLHAVLAIAYGSMSLQVLFCCVLFALTRELWRFREMFWLAWLGLLITCLISAFLPAAGITARYAIQDPAWRAHLTILRSGHPILAEIGGMKGIVFFPSYHAELAIIFAYVNRNAGLLSWFMLGLNALMMLSALSEGDHYLVDVIAGILVTSGLIALLRYSGWLADPLSDEARLTAR
jgi:hypothetical protein